jgi:acetyl-CoA synthetase
MTASRSYPIPNSFSDAHVTPERYEALYQQSLEDPTVFWSEQATLLDWHTPWNEVSNTDISTGTAHWFVGARLNVSVNCIDRHLPHRADDIAIIWEGDHPDDSQSFTYQELKDHVCRFANVLKDRGVGKGDRVCIYMPMIPEAAFAMLACARIGAIHSVVFGGFSPEALKDRINDAACRMVITADEGVRGGKTVPLKQNVDAALAQVDCVDSVIVVRRTGCETDWNEGRDVWYHEAISSISDDCEPEWMDSEDPLFILYTSGSTGKPKGVLHTTGGYLLQAAMSMKYVFDYREGETYWCTADVGWVTGHTYIVYGPLAIGARTLMFEGVPTYPAGDRFWQVIAKHEVNLFFTAPTAIRALHGLGDELVTRHDRSSLRIIGSVGEPINPEAWEWYHRVVGDSRCPIVDTWWQTETGGVMITPLPGAHALKPGVRQLSLFWGGTGASG